MNPTGHCEKSRLQLPHSHSPWHVPQHFTGSAMPTRLSFSCKSCAMKKQTYTNVCQAASQKIESYRQLYHLKELIATDVQSVCNNLLCLHFLFQSQAMASCSIPPRWTDFFQGLSALQRQKDGEHQYRIYYTINNHIYRIRITFQIMLKL